MGDYNINLLNYDVHSSTVDFVDMIYSYSFMPLINRPTRITRDSATIIDNIFTNNLPSLEGSLHGILVTDISDHFPVFHVSLIPNRCDIEIKAYKRNYSYRNKRAFMEAKSETDWSEIYSITDTQVAFTRFYLKFVNLYNKHFQKRRVCKKYHANLLEANKSNLKKTWNILKGMINRNKSSRIQEKFKLNDGSITTDGNIICSHFNDFFINIGPNLANWIKSPNILTKSIWAIWINIPSFLNPWLKRKSTIL